MKHGICVRDKSVLVLGAGISGVAAYNLLVGMGAHPVLYDANENVNREGLYERLVHGSDAQILLGALPVDVRATFDLLVISPGVPTDSEIPVWFGQNGKDVLGEIELAYLAGKGNVIAITGTNGKTTTTALVGEITRQYYGKSHVVGNIGIPYTEVAAGIGEGEAVVAEVSSFQLETIHSFRPHVSAILNVTPDHLDRHHTMENYIAAKTAVTMNQTADDFCVLNYDDEITRGIGERIAATVGYFSVNTILKEGCFLRGDEIVLRQTERNVC